MTGRNRRAEAVVWLAVSLGVAFLLWRAYDGVKVAVELSSSESVAAGAAAYRNLECVETGFRTLVPPGSRVHLRIEGLPSLAAVAAAFPDREVVASADQADVVFAFRDPTNQDLCAEEAFGVTRTPGRS